MSGWSETFTRCMNDLSSRIDPAEDQTNRLAWEAFVDGKCEEEFFVPPARTPRPPKCDWPDVHINDANDGDFELMLLSQFKMVSDELAKGSSLRLCVRCNYGTGILPTQFGCDLYAMPRETNTLPTAVPLHSRDKVQAIVDAGPPDPRAGLGAKVLDCAEHYLAVFENYPVLAEHIALYHPDWQGPIDVAEVVWGSEIFYAIFDEPDFVRSFLEVMTQTYAQFARAWFAMSPPSPRGYNVHWSWMHKGVLVLREDSLMNLSPETYVDLIRPLDQRLFDEFGGGFIHYCGRGEHFVPPMSEMKGLTAIQLSQPDYNDMEVIYQNTVDKGIPLLGLERSEVDRAIAAGRPLRGLVHTSAENTIKHTCGIPS
ncbi:MAG: hypothetical protein JXA11_09445 [Phycisphaerae bacterium]|nr:hypothetical protein [Phycisphaerae bacterium]